MGERVNARDCEVGEEKVVRVNRTSAVVKGGRRFSFSAVVVVGDRKGVVGYGQGKAREVPACIEKAVSDARKNLVRYPLRGDTIPHQVVGRYRASKVLLKPAAPGTGIKAGATVRAVVEELGIRNLLTKVHGSVNPTNVVKAVINGLEQLRSKKETFELRGLPVHPDRDRPKLMPVGHEEDERGERRGKGKGGRDAKGKGGPRGKGGKGKERGKGAPQAGSPKPEANKPATAAPAETPAESPKESGGDAPEATESKE